MKLLLRTRYHVSPERSRLCVEASEATVQAAQLLRPQDVSVYVGIPFCPTRWKALAATFSMTAA